MYAIIFTIYNKTTEEKQKQLIIMDIYFFLEGEGENHS